MWSVWFFANRHYLFFLVTGENFKSIGQLDLSYWYHKNGTIWIYRPVCKIPTRKVANLKFCTQAYIINTYHWWKFQVKSISGSRDTELHYLYFTDQVCKLHNIGLKPNFLVKFHKKHKNRNYYQNSTFLVNWFTHNSQNGYFDPGLQNTRIWQVAEKKFPNS